jgi:hypothetical protein
MKNGVLILVLIFAAALLATATINLPTENVKRSIVFIYADNGNGQPNTANPLATGFFVQIPLKSNPEQSYYLLVTARHVLDPQWAGCPPHQNPIRIFLRLNRKIFNPVGESDGVGYLPVSLRNDSGTKTFATDPDDSVDAAVIPVNARTVAAEYEIDGVPISLFPTDEEAETLKKSGIGEEILSAGLLPTFPGVRRNYPFFKFGNISNIPDERIEVPCAPGEPPRLLRLWFIAANLVPGNSGSPIFLVPPGAGG